MTASGRTPQPRHTAARDTCRAKSSGCTTSTGCAETSVRSASMRDHPATVRSASSHCSIAVRKVGSVANSPRPMPDHCEPCPENTNASPAVPSGSLRAASGRPASSRWRSASSSSSDPAATTASRYACSVRRLAAAQIVPTGWPTRASRCAAASSPSAAGVWAESSSSSARGGPGRTGLSASALGASGRGPDRITWALVPPMPNPLEPTTRGPSSRRHRRRSAAMRRGVPPSSKAGLGRSKWSVLGISPCSMASTHLISPARPAAASRWPRFDFTDPTRQPGCGSPSANAPARASSSMGSPSAVPVPCAST